MNGWRQLKDQFDNDRQHGLLHHLSFDPLVQFFPQDPSYLALDRSVPAVVLCRLMSAEGCGVQVVRQRMQRRSPSIFPPRPKQNLLRPSKTVPVPKSVPPPGPPPPGGESWRA